ncbi:MAG TPA: 30S ribosome-binding factor RbfA [Desulfobacteraceae bacterium]|nr:30S ribosome-binding factor RbfA [Desulfobacteraceae bacterium]
MAGKRSTRVGGQIFKEISILLVEKIRDPRVRDVTLTGVDLSRDLKSAKVYFSVIGDENAVGGARAGLESAKGVLKKEIGRRLPLRYVPELFFAHDRSLERGMRMEHLLEELKKDDGLFE